MFEDPLAEVCSGDMEKATHDVCASLLPLVTTVCLKQGDYWLDTIRERRGLLALEVSTRAGSLIRLGSPRCIPFLPICENRTGPEWAEEVLAQ